MDATSCCYKWIGGAVAQMVKSERSGGLQLKDGTGSRGRVKTKHQNRMKVLLGGSSEEVVFTDQQLCQTGVRAGRN